MKGNKKVAIALIIIGIMFAIGRGCFHVYAYYQYENKIGNNWDLADRASTIIQKSEYINKFVAALEKEKLDGVHNALFFPNDENDFTQNMKALKSLQNRLQDISMMDENSFAYQSAMQQITAQEQGEATALLSNLQGCWLKVNYYTLWNNLICLIFLVLQICSIVFGRLMLRGNPLKSGY